VKGFEGSLSLAYDRCESIRFRCRGSPHR